MPGQPLRGDGWGLDVTNWAVGVTVSFPVLEGFAVNARKRVEAQNELAERARHEQAIQTGHDATDACTGADDCGH